MADTTEATATAPATPSPTEGAAGTAAPTPTPDPTAEIATLREQLAAQTQNTEAVKRYVAHLVTQLQTAQAEPEIDPDDRKAKLAERLQSDPESALDAMLQDRLGPLMREQYRHAGELAKAEAARLAEAEGWGEEWKEHVTDVDAFMADVPLDRHANPKTWVDALKLRLVMSGKFDELAIKRAEKRLAREREAASEGASPGRIGPKGPAAATPEQKKMAEAFGMSLEDYLKHDAAIQGVG